MATRTAMFTLAAKAHAALPTIDRPNFGMFASKAAPVMTHRWITVVLILMTLVGCSSETLPPPLDADQLKAIATTRFKATVGVRPYTAPVYSDELIEDLRKTQLFEKVDSLDAFQTPPTFVARVDEGIYGTATIPIFTMLSLGLIPTIVDEAHGAVFSFAPSATPRARIAINFRYHGPSTLGWWALFQGALPDRTWGAANTHVRFVQSIAWHIVEHEKGRSTAARK
jgi:hypothetical protein